LDDSWLDYDALVIPVAGTRSLEDTLFSRYLDAFEAIRFIAFYSEVEVVVVSQGFNADFTDATKLAELSKLLDI
jgi:hypothetical protein